MDNFRDLVEADFGSLLASAGTAIAGKLTNKGKEIGNRFLAALSSARAQGRLDLQMVQTDLRNSFKYYRTTQGKNATVESFVDFVNTVFGLNMPEASIYRAIYGFDPKSSPKPPQLIAPHKSVMDTRLRTIFSVRSTQEKLLAASQSLATYASQNEGDANYITAMMTWLGSKNPQLLQRAGMEPLEPYTHGGNLSNEQLEKLLQGFASLLIKKQTILQRMGDEEKSSDGELAAEKSDHIDPKSSTEDGTWGGLPLPQEVKRPILYDEIRKNIIQAGYKNFTSFDYYAPFADNDEMWLELREHFEQIDKKRCNAISTQCLIYVASHFREQNMRLAFVQTQSKSGGIFWPEKNIAAVYNFLRRGGNYDEVTAELNHFANTPERASLILTTALRLIAKEEAARKQTTAPGDASASESGE